MQDRPAATDDRDVRHINPHKMYEFLASIGTGVGIGSLGLGAGQVISKNASLITALCAEGFTTLMSLVTVVHESIDVCSIMCCRRDGQTVIATNHPPTQYSLYLTFRIMANLASVVGVVLVAIDLSNETVTAKTTVGFALIAINAYVARQLSSSTKKPAGVVVAGVEDEMEQGRLAPLQRSAVLGAPHAAMWQQRRALRRPEVEQVQQWEAVPLEKVQTANDSQVMPVEAQSVPQARSVVASASQPNQFFQAEPAVAPPPATAPKNDQPYKKGYIKVPRKR